MEIETDKSYVGMATCFLCGEVKHLLLDKRLKNSLNHKACYDKEPCDKCKDYMKKGIIIIGVKDNETDKENPYRTGEFFVIKEKAVLNMPMNEDLKNNIIKQRICFIEQNVLKNWGFNKYLKKKK